MVVQWGLFRGFSSSTTNVIDHSGAGQWVTPNNTAYLEQAVPFNERKYYQVLATPGVLMAAKYIERFAVWKEPNGRSESIAVIGCDPNVPLGIPWGMVQGNPQQLKEPDSVVVDRIYRDKLDAKEVGSSAEINGYRARV